MSSALDADTDTFKCRGGNSYQTADIDEFAEVHSGSSSVRGPFFRLYGATTR